MANVGARRWTREPKDAGIQESVEDVASRDKDLLDVGDTPVAPAASTDLSSNQLAVREGEGVEPVDSGTQRVEELGTEAQAETVPRP